MGYHIGEHPTRSHLQYFDFRRPFEQAISAISETLELRPLNPVELSLISRQYQSDLIHGITHEAPSSLKMYDTLLPAVDINTLPRDKKALVIEIGGTKLRYAYIHINQQGKYVEERFHSIPIGRTEYTDANDFYDHVLEKIGQLDEKPDALGIVWSFPGTAFYRTDGLGVDVTTPEEEMTKEYGIPGLGQRPVGAVLLEKLNSKHGWNTNLPMAVMNDTRAVEGGIVGTGFNLAFGRYNTESGGFNGGIPKHKLPAIYRIIDARSKKPGAQLTEKQVSGAYLGEAMTVIGETLRDKGLTKQDLPTMDALFISHILDRKRPINVDIYSQIPDPTIYSAFRYGAAKLAQRSAQLVGMHAGTGILTFQHDFPDPKIKFPIDGSVFWGIPGYEKIAEEHANAVLIGTGKKITFVNIEHAGMKGAAAAALSMIPAA